METNNLEEFEEKQLSPSEKRVVAFIRIYLYLWGIIFLLCVIMILLDILRSLDVINPDDIVNYIKNLK